MSNTPRTDSAAFGIVGPNHPQKVMVVPAETMETIERELGEALACIRLAMPILHAYASDNHIWRDDDGIQDPNGVHALVRRIESANDTALLRQAGKDRT